MIINIEHLKKKIVYRSNYRGTKEMDILLSSFTNKYINLINDAELSLLSDLLDFGDEDLYKFNQGQKTSLEIKKNRITDLFKAFVYKKP